MTIKLNRLLFLLVLGLPLALRGQSTWRSPGELLLQLNDEAAPATVLNQLLRAAPGNAPMAWKSVVAADWHVYLLEFNETGADPALLLAAARRNPDIRAAQWNYRVQYRYTQPNDPDWFKQDNMTLINMPDVWDVATGGLTPAGDTIVVAVLEQGALLEHPDVVPNVWYNRGEIPNNGLDDDGNGFKDDYRGWNPRTQNDDPGFINFHGTAVNGIIGAKGNNGVGISGVNWNVKLMNISDTEKESEIISGYNYVAKMRRLYNTTNGAKGAFVVATNASFGVDNAWAADHPLWCAVYDSLGAVGVLSVGATTNSETNVDQEGDMPSTCPSQYLIIVNSVDKLDKRWKPTGTGAVNVDLAAPGQSYSTLSEGLNPTYGPFEGTSSAAPHVTGAVALLYNLNCPDLTADALTQPALCAKRMRDLLLQNVAPNSTLDSVTVTGGRLDVNATVRAVQQLCDGATTGRLAIEWVRPNPAHTELRIRFQTPTYSPYKIRVFNMLGQLMFEDSVDPDPFISNERTYDVSRLPIGVYSISFGRNDAWRSEKFVKK